MARLRRIHRSLIRHQPTYLLSLRVVTAYGVSSLDSLSDAVPLSALQVVPLQRAVDAALTSALRIPNTAPKVYLYAPLLHGGFGVPCLATRFALRFIHTVFRAATSRNSLVRRSVQHFMERPQLLAPVPNDVLTFHEYCDRWSLCILFPPCEALQPALPTTSHIRRYCGGPVLLMSDGSAPTGCLGWGALIADSTGILATTHAGVSCDISYSHAAEWAGKLAALQLADSLGIPKEQWQWSIADNMSACIGADGGRPSRAPWIDAIRLAFASLSSQSPLQEGYTPAAHNTGWTHFASELQAVCDTLAAAGAKSAQPFHYPFPSLLDGRALLFRCGRIVVDTRHTLDGIYHQEHASPLHQLTQSLPDYSVLPSWQTTVLSADISPSAMRLAFWLRTSPHTHLSSSVVFHCPVCSVPCSGWGAHLLSDCPITVAAVLRGFQSIATHLEDSGRPLHWHTSTAFQLGPQRWQLLPDHAVQAPTTSHPWAVGVTWSGLLWVRPPHCLPAALRTALSTTFLNSAGSWPCVCFASPSAPPPELDKMPVKHCQP